MNNFALLMLSLSVPQYAFANNFDYHTFEVRAATGTETVGGEVYLPLSQNSHVVTRFDSHLERDWDAAVGLGFNGPVNRRMDIYGQILGHHVKYTEAVALEELEDSVVYAEVNFGGRFWLSDRIEISGHYGRLMNDDDEKSAFIIGTRFHSTPKFSVGVDWKNYQVYDHQLALSVRFSYR